MQNQLRQDNPSQNEHAATEAIRTLLFLKAEARNEQVLRCLADVASHLGAKNELAVIGALAGLEGEVAHIRTLMMLCRDSFPRTQKGEK